MGYDSMSQHPGLQLQPDPQLENQMHSLKMRAQCVSFLVTLPDSMNHLDGWQSDSRVNECQKVTHEVPKLTHTAPNIYAL